MQTTQDTTKKRGVRFKPTDHFLGFTIDLSAPGVESRDFTFYIRSVSGFTREDIYIDWGDGSAVETFDSHSHVDANSPIHSYRGGGNEFDVIVWTASGKLPSCFTDACPVSSSSAISNIWNWTVCSRLFAHTFQAYRNLSGLDMRIFSYLDSSSDIRYFAWNTPSLNIELTRDTFQHITKTDYSCMFQNSPANEQDYGFSKVHGVVPVMPNTTTCMYCLFARCRDLTGTIPPYPDSVTNLYAAYAYCDLTGSIPPFPPNVTDMNTVYGGNSRLTGSIPPIPTTVELRGLAYAFEDCSGLTGTIPELPPNITSLLRTFVNCSGLTGGVPDIPIGVTELQSAFQGCSRLTGSIPTLPPNAKDIYCAFDSCVGLTGSTPAIPLTVTRASYVFWGCTGLDGTIGSIPTQTTATFNGTFYNCTHLTGSAPPLWDSSVYPNITQPTTRNYCFYNCTGLDNYDEIPALWK